MRTCHLEVRPGIQFVASLGRPTTARLLHDGVETGQVGTMAVQDEIGYHPEIRVHEMT